MPTYQPDKLQLRKCLQGEMAVSLQVYFSTFYLLNQFPPGQGELNHEAEVIHGQGIQERMGFRADRRV